MKLPMFVHKRGVARVAGIAALAGSACSDVQSPTAVDSEARPPSFSQAGVVGIATGSGHSPSGGALRVFTFTAHARADGTVQGRFRIGLIANDAWFSAEVTCVTFDGNTAWVGGIIEDTNVPGLVQVGSASEFYVIDNGEGSEATADIVSTALFNQPAGNEQLFCADQPLALPPRTVTEGNVQVRGGS